MVTLPAFATAFFGSKANSDILTVSVGLAVVGVVVVGAVADGVVFPSLALPASPSLRSEGPGA